MKDIAFIYHIAKMAANRELPKQLAFKLITKRIKACSLSKKQVKPPEQQ